MSPRISGRVDIEIGETDGVRIVDKIEVYVNRARPTASLEYY